MDCTPEELRDAELSMVALIRANHNGDTEGRDAILDVATPRELRAITEAYIAAFGDLLVKLTLAHAYIEDEAERAAVRIVDVAQAMTEPNLHAAVKKNITGIQAAIIREG